MPFTTDYSTDIGKTRALMNDVDSTSQLFQDDQVQAFLDLNDGIVQLAAVQGILAMASRFARMRKVKIMDVDVDGSIAAKDLRLIAAQIREDYFNDPSFDIAKNLSTTSALREDIINQLRQEDPLEFI